MKEWSTKATKDFRIEIFLDTQILAYLIDDKYPAFSEIIKFLKDTDFVDLTTSKYVIFEFIGIRKREHYLREVFNSFKTDNINAKAIDFENFIKNKLTFQFAFLPFKNIQKKLEQKVNEEREQLISEFGIQHLNNTVHDGLFNQVSNLYLNTRLQKDDSFVISSAIWPDEDNTNEQVIIWSNDEEMIKAYTECEDFDSMFSMQKPTLEYISSLVLLADLTTTGKNLLEDKQLVGNKEFLIKKIKEFLIKKNEKFYLGQTHKGTKKAGIICFTLIANKVLEVTIDNTNPFLTIIGKDLSFIITTAASVSEFQKEGKALVLPISYERDEKLAFSWPAISDEHPYKEHEEEILKLLKEEGNLVFISPDSI